MLANFKELCPPTAPLYGYLGIALCIALGCFGSAIGTARAGASLLTSSAQGKCHRSVMRNLLPVVMAGVLGVYSLVVGVVISGSITAPDPDGRTKYSQYVE